MGKTAASSPGAPGGHFPVVRPIAWLLLALSVAAVAAAVTLWSVRRTRTAIRNWFRRAVLRAVHQFRVRIARYKLVSRRAVREDLLADPQIVDAIREHAAAHGVTELDARVRVERYIEEMVPQFNVLTYYRVGYNLARVLVNLLYRVTARQRDPAALAAVPRDDVIVYLMNHRSNADYVIVAYVLAKQVSISYAVGEWARVWPLEYVFKAFGAYFVRRRYRERLYHAVLERYVQRITRHGVTQGIFLEGGLSRNGALRPAKIGLLDYIARTLNDPHFSRDIWLVPVALNYDRVLEDRSLILELLEARERPGRLRQLTGVIRYLGTNALRLVTGNLKRYGRVAVEFGTPLSLRAWAREHPGVLDLPRDQRLPAVQRLADDVLAWIGAIMPVTPVPLVAAALLSFEETIVEEQELLDRIETFSDYLRRAGGHPFHHDLGAEGILDRAGRMLAMRRLAVREGSRFVLLPRQRPLLEFYANSIKHLLPVPVRTVAMHPARDPDRDLPRLKDWKPG